MLLLVHLMTEVLLHAFVIDPLKYGLNIRLIFLVILVMRWRGLHV